jgi:hypothetical protein
MQLNLHPSRYFLTLILLAHIAAIIVTMTLAIKWWIIVLLEALIVGNFSYMFQRYIMRKFNKSILALWQEGTHWTLLSRDGSKLPAILLPDSTVTNFLVILSFRLENNKRHSVLVFSDSIDKLSFKRLKKCLKTWKF